MGGEGADVAQVAVALAVVEAVADDELVARNERSVPADVPPVTGTGTDDRGLVTVVGATSSTSGT